jgi:hypothetical protein
MISPEGCAFFVFFPNEFKIDFKKVHPLPAIRNTAPWNFNLVSCRPLRALLGFGIYFEGMKETA